MKAPNKLNLTLLLRGLIDHIYLETVCSRGGLPPVVLKESSALLQVLRILAQVPHIVTLRASDGGVNDGPRDPALDVCVQKPLKLAMIRLPWQGEHRPATWAIFSPEMQKYGLLRHRPGPEPFRSVLVSPHSLWLWRHGYVSNGLRSRYVGAVDDLPVAEADKVSGREGAPACLS